MMSVADTGSQQEAEEGKREAAGIARSWQVPFWSMVGIQFMMAMSQTFPTPIMPVLLPEIGITDKAQVEFLTGVLNATGCLVAVFTTPLWGRLGDRSSRKLMVMRCSLTIGLCTGFMSLAQHFWQLFILQALQGGFSGFQAAAMALVAAQVPEERLGMALGWLGTAYLTGGMMGPVLGGTLNDLMGNARLPFCATGILCTAVTLLVWSLVPEPVRPPEAARQRMGLVACFSMAAKSGLLPLFFVLIATQFAVRSVQPIITPFVASLGGVTGALTTMAGLAFSIAGLADFIASPFLGKRSDRIGYRRVLLICSAGATIAVLPQIFVHSYWLFLAERFMIGVFVGGMIPTAQALIGRLTPAANRSLVYGITGSAVFLGAFSGPLVGGSVAFLFGTRWVFAVTALMMAVNFWFVLTRVDDPTRPKH
jgi:DHA1 family multidrug resistance protein-like MFS transporter